MAGGINPFVYSLNNPINFVDPYGLWTIWAGGSGVAAVENTGGNAGAGFAFDSDLGAGTYITKGKTKGLAASGGLEGGFYTGSITGETTIVTAGVLSGSIGIVTGEKWWHIGIVFGWNYGAPLEATISDNTTVFAPISSPSTECP